MFGELSSRRKSRCSAVGTECLLFRRKRFHSDHRGKVQHGTMHSVPRRLFPLPYAPFAPRVAQHPSVLPCTRLCFRFSGPCFGHPLPLPLPRPPLPPTPFSGCLNRGATGEKRGWAPHARRVGGITNTPQHMLEVLSCRSLRNSRSLLAFQLVSIYDAYYSILPMLFRFAFEISISST